MARVFSPVLTQVRIQRKTFLHEFSICLRQNSIPYTGMLILLAMLTTVHATDQKITYEMIQTKPFKPHQLYCVYTLDKSTENLLSIKYC